MFPVVVWPGHVVGKGSLGPLKQTSVAVMAPPHVVSLSFRSVPEGSAALLLLMLHLLAAGFSCSGQREYKYLGKGSLQKL